MCARGGGRGDRWHAPAISAISAARGPRERTLLELMASRSSGLACFRVDRAWRTRLRLLLAHHRHWMWLVSRSALAGAGVSRRRWTSQCRLRSSAGPQLLQRRAQQSWRRRDLAICCRCCQLHPLPCRARPRSSLACAPQQPHRYPVYWCSRSPPPNLNVVEQGRQRL